MRRLALLALPALLAIMALVPSQLITPVARATPDGACTVANSCSFRHVQATSDDVCPNRCPFKQIQAAIDAASSGATIRIGPGAYEEYLSISKNVTLVGASTVRTILLPPDNLSKQGVIVQVQAPATVTLSHLTIANGGTGLVNLGTLTMDDVQISDNGSGPSGGGGIINHGVLHLSAGDIERNISASQGGGIRNEAGATMTIHSALIMENHAVTEGGGIWNAGNLSLRNARVLRNVARRTGGGIFNASGGTVHVEDSTFQQNSPNNCVNLPEC